MYRRSAALFTVAVLLTGGLVGFLGTPAAQAVTTVSPASPASSKPNATAAYMSYAATRSVATGWTGNTAGCVAGTPSAAHQTATFAAVNYFRTMAGLSPVSEDRTLSAQAQQAALVFDANGSLTHYIPSTWACYTTTAANSASTSNISFNYPNGPTAISGYINDSDPGNAPMVGHRQWILDPLLTTFGSGTTTRGGALQWGGAATSTATANPAIIAWPSAGYFPYEISFDKPGLYYESTPLTAWSVQSTTGNFAAARVTVTLNGSAVTVGAITTTSGYGASRALIWQMPTIARPAAGAVNDYKVTVTGVTGLPDNTYTYDVLVFNATEVSITSASITGTARFGQTLTANASGVSPSGATLTYQWRRGTADISGATGRTYTAVAADVGQSISVKVTGSYTDPTTGTAFAPTTATSPSVTVTAAPMTPSVTLATTAKIDVVLTANTASWAPAGATFTYQWLSGTTVRSTTGSTYTPTAADVGSTITVKVTGSMAGYTTSTAQATTGMVQTGTMTPSVTLSGTAQVGTALVANTTSWAPPGVTLTYQWLSGTTIITSATGSSYTPTTSDIGKTITVKVTGTKAGYVTNNGQAVSATVLGKLTSATPTISGTAVVGQTLTANPGSWAPASTTLTYQWTRNGTAISGATARTYQASASDVGARIAVTVTGAYPSYATVSVGSAAVTVASGVFSTVGTPAISGSFTAGSTVTASPGTWSPAPASCTYQWLRDGAAISGATTQTLRLTATDYGHAISVRVTCSSPGFTSVMATSGRTSVAAPTTLTPLAGSDRYATGVAICQMGWQRASSASVRWAVLARGDIYPDALAGGPLAAALDGPLLLTSPTSLDPRVSAELSRLNVTNVIILGGLPSISQAVQNQLVSSGYRVERLAGSDRFQTAVLIAQRLKVARGGTPTTDVFLANGLNFPDALSVSPVAAAEKMPILFTPSGDSALNASTRGYLVSEKPSGKLYVLGGLPSVTDGAAAEAGRLMVTAGFTRIGGADRFATSLLIYQQFRSVFATPGPSVVTTGLKFPDALSGGVFAAKIKAPLFLVNGTTSNLADVATVAAAVASRGAGQPVYVLGDANSVTTAVAITIAGAETTGRSYLGYLCRSPRLPSRCGNCPAPLALPCEVGHDAASPRREGHYRGDG